MAYERGVTNYNEGVYAPSHAIVDESGRLLMWPSMCIGSVSPGSNPFGGLPSGPYTRASSLGPFPAQGMGDLSSPSGIFGIAVLGFAAWWLYKRLR